MTAASSNERDSNAVHSVRNPIVARTLRATLLAVLVAAGLQAAPAAADALDDGLAAYLNGQYEGALRLWKPIAEAGNPHAQNNLGIMYENGEGVPRDPQEAARLYRMAAEQGHAEGQLNLGLMYENGRGVPQDLVRAHMWFSLSSAIGQGQMEWAGLGATVSRDRVAAKLTPDQLARSQALARRCQESAYKLCG